MFATVGIVGALLHRERSGTGEYVDVSMSDGLLSWMGTSLEPVLNGVEQRAGSREPAYGVFLCGDGKYISLSIAHEDHFWRPLCEQLGRPDLSELRGGERRARRDELREIIADRLAHDSRDHWVELLAAANVATGPVLSLSEVVEDPHNRAREMFVSGGDGSDRQWYVAHPLKFAETQAREPSPAPQLGQHTDVILRELGHGGADIERLREGGAL
jgi:crotonobetainyl-CoA:carnitine CoA-transferase CaiB-like acyl-CoA transferase